MGGNLTFLSKNGLSLTLIVQIQNNANEVGPSYGRLGPHMAQEKKIEITGKLVTGEKDNGSFQPT